MKKFLGLHCIGGNVNILLYIPLYGIFYCFSVLSLSTLRWGKSNFSLSLDALSTATLLYLQQIQEQVISLCIVFRRILFVMYLYVMFNFNFSMISKYKVLRSPSHLSSQHCILTQSLSTKLSSFDNLDGK